MRNENERSHQGCKDEIGRNMQSKNDILEQALSTIEFGNDNNDINNTQSSLSSTPMSRKEKFPSNTGNFVCPECNLRFETALVRDFHDKMVHKRCENTTQKWSSTGQEFIYYHCPVCTQEVAKDVLYHVQMCEKKTSAAVQLFLI